MIDSDDLNRVLPEVDAGDSQALLEGLADDGIFYELFPSWGKEIRVALARVGGRTCGLVVSNAAENDGELAPASAAKERQRQVSCRNEPENA